MTKAHSFGTLSCQMGNNNNKVYVSWLSSALKPVVTSCTGMHNSYHSESPDGEDMEDYFLLKLEIRTKQ